MRALLTPALVAATVAGAPVPPVDLPPLPVELPRIERPALPQPVEDVLPDLPIVSTPTPAPTPAPTAAPTPEPTAAPPPPAPSPAPAAPAAASTPRADPPPAADSPDDAPDAARPVAVETVARGAPRPAATPRAVVARPVATPTSPPTSVATPSPRAGARPRPPAPRRRQEPAAAAGAARASASPDPTGTAPPRPARATAPPRVTPEPPRSLGAGVVRIVRVLPPALLWALGAMSALALALAANALWQSRRRAALAAQRAALQADVGLLSGALLPPVPDALDGLVVSAAYRPADGPAAGGDFYDVFALGEERTGVLLGDVSGHGRDSVADAALARYTLRTLLAAGHTPGEALARADKLLHQDLAPDFVTVIAGIYDHARGELTYAKAGHAPPIVLGAPHDPDAEEPACPLGIGFGATWPEYRLAMTPGLAVCLFTDGLEDARRDGGRLGREEVQRLLAAQPAPDATALIAAIAAAADQMPDDTAAVVLRRP